MKLILVGGTGRSGTSMVYHRLSLNDELHGYAEFESRLFTLNNSLLDIFDVYVSSYSPERFDFCSAAFKANVIRAFENVYQGKRFSLEILKKPGKLLPGYLDDFITGLESDRLQYPALEECFKKRADLLLQQLFKFDPATSNALIEKTPHNVLHFGRIKNIFPDAKLLHIVRDPRAVAESVVRQSWGTNNYKEAVIWVKLILETWMRQYQNREFDVASCRCIRVEDLVTKFETKENLVRDFLGEKLDKLKLYANPEALDGWKDNISTGDFEYANRELKDVLQFFSYSKDIVNSEEQSKYTEFDNI